MASAGVEMQAAAAVADAVGDDGVVHVVGGELAVVGVSLQK